MDEAIEQVINQHPGREAHIRLLWAADETFQELVQDYALCLETLTRWSGVLVSRARKTEYASLCQRLEFEIEMRISDVHLQRE